MVMKADVQQFEFHVVDMDKEAVAAVLVAAAGKQIDDSKPINAPDIDYTFNPQVVMDAFGCKVYFKAKKASVPAGGG